jgi:hypothetical protein
VEETAGVEETVGIEEVAGVDAAANAGEAGGTGDAAGMKEAAGVGVLGLADAGEGGKGGEPAGKLVKEATWEEYSRHTRVTSKDLLSENDQTVVITITTLKVVLILVLVLGLLRLDLPLSGAVMNLEPLWEVSTSPHLKLPVVLAHLETREVPVCICPQTFTDVLIDGAP